MNEEIDVHAAAVRIYENFYGLHFASKSKEYEEPAQTLTKVIRAYMVEKIEAAIRGI